MRDLRAFVVDVLRTTLTYVGTSHCSAFGTRFYSNMTTLWVQRIGTVSMSRDFWRLYACTRKIGNSLRTRRLKESTQLEMFANVQRFAATFFDGTAFV